MAGGSGWDWGGLCACLCLLLSLSVPRCPPDCLPLSVCSSLLSCCQAEEKMQSEVSPHPLLTSAPAPVRAVEAPLISALSPQQIRKLRRELESSQEKVATLTSQLSANVSPHGSPCGAPHSIPAGPRAGVDVPIDALIAPFSLLHPTPGSRCSPVRGFLPTCGGSPVSPLLPGQPGGGL